MTKPLPTYLNYDPATHFLQPRLPGYKQISDEQASLMRSVKLAEQEIGSLIGFVRRGLEKMGLVVDHRTGRQLAMARSDFEVAFYHLNRAIANPDDPLDPSKQEAVLATHNTPTGE